MTKHVRMSRHVLVELSEERGQGVAVRHAHEPLGVELPRHLHLGEEKGGIEGRIDGQRPGALEVLDHGDGALVARQRVVVALVQEVEGGAVAAVGLQPAGVVVRQHLGHARVRRYGRVRVEEPPQLRPQLRRVVGEDARAAVRQTHAEVAPRRGVAGQRLHRPSLPHEAGEELRRVAGERRTNGHRPPVGAGPFSSGFASRMTIFSIVVGLFGRSFAPRGALTILSATSIPFVTFPNTVYCLSRHGESEVTMKNCDEALFGSFERAMETMPRTCEMLLNSALIFLPEPPVPQVAGEPETVFGSPPWIMKPGMTRWNFVPL